MSLNKQQKEQLFYLFNSAIGCIAILSIMTYFDATNSTKWIVVASSAWAAFTGIFSIAWKNKTSF